MAHVAFHACPSRMIKGCPEERQCAPAGGPDKTNTLHPLVERSLGVSTTVVGSHIEGSEDHCQIVI